MADDEHVSYLIKYGPAVIFSNIVPGLDVNFINPKYTTTNPYYVEATPSYSVNSDFDNRLDALSADNFDTLMNNIFNILGENLNDSAKDVKIVITTDYMQGNECQIEIHYKHHCIYIYTGDNGLMEDLSKIISGKNKYNGSKSYSYSEFKTIYANNKTTIDEVIKNKKWSWTTSDNIVASSSDKVTIKEPESFIVACSKYTDYMPYNDTEATKSINESLEEYGYNSATTKGKIDINNDTSTRYISKYQYWWNYNDAKNNTVTRALEVTQYENYGSGETIMSYYIYDTTYSSVVSNKTGDTKLSTAFELQNTISTWYKALRAIALVGLLSVLVYVGIRILISSTGQEKAKYKKMIGDWLAAICILFILQYLMVFILDIVQKITDVLSSNAIGSNGEDVLMSNLRADIGTATTFSAIFTELLMYLVLVIYTVMFTIQYLKRLVYMAFFTMIAPLIALTYPLDKIKDGQAQAFSTWIREYIFNALLQPMHLLLYTIFVGSAMDLVNSNPLYGIVVVGFLLPAEKFFRKMFGFDKAQSSSQFGAAAGGALIMNAINKMGHKSGKHAAGGSASSGGSGSSSVRTASSNGVTVGAGDGGTTPTSGGTAGDFGATRTANQFGPTMGRALSAPKGSGMAAIGRRFINANTAKKVGRMARRGLVGAAGAATLGTVGLAAGLATGDFGKALQYGATGVGAGYMGANYLGDKALEGEKSLRETFKEGQIGQNEYNNLKADKEFYNSAEFRNMVNNPNLLTGTTGLGRTAAMRNEVQVYRDSGITDTGKIATAMKSGLSPQEGAYAIKLAEMIGRSGWNNPSTRKDFETRYKSKIPGTNGNKIWNSIEDLL